MVLFMNYLQVRIPVMEVVPLRRAEKGSTLEFDAFARDGTLVAEEGTELTEELLERFERFHVRKVVVTSPREQWVPESETESLPSGAEIIQEREFSEAAEQILDDVQSTDSVEQMRKTAMYLQRQARRSGNDEAADCLDSLIDRSRRLEQEIDRLSNRLSEVEDEEAREEITRALEGKIRQLEEAFMEVNAPGDMLKETVDAVNEREEIRHSLSDFVHENADLVNEKLAETEDAVPDRLKAEEASTGVAAAISCFNRGASVKGVEALMESETVQNSTALEEELKTLHKQLAGQRESVEKFKNLLSKEVDDLETRRFLIDVLEGRQSVNRQELMELPISRSFASKTYELVEEQLDAHHELWNQLQQVADGDLEMERGDFIDRSLQKPDPDGSSDGEDETSLGDGELVEVLERFDDSPSRALERLERAVQEDDGLPTCLEAEVSMARSQWQSLVGDRDDLEERIGENVSDAGVRETLIAFLRGDRSFDPDQLMGLDANPRLLEEVGDFITRRQSREQDLWQLLDQVSEGDINNHDSEVVREEVERAEEALNVRQRTSRQWGSGSNGDGGESSSASVGDQRPVMEVVEEGDPYEVAERTGLEPSDVKVALDILEGPQDLEGEERMVFEPLSREVKEMFYRRTADEETILETAQSLSSTLESEQRPFSFLQEPPAGDRYLLTHGLNTAMVTVLLGQYFELNDSELLDVTAASLAGDLGMVTIPSGLWLNDGNLTPRGEQELQNHPHRSDEIVSSVFNGDEVIGDLVKQHHERVDGSGYPQTIEKDEQHPLAPIVAAADAYTAMLEPRPYREAISPDRALMSMLKSSGEYDPGVLKGLVYEIGIYPNGSVVLLSDGRLGLVHSQNPDHPLKPSLMVLTDRERNRLDDPRPLDLSDSSDASVKKLVRT